MRGKKKTEDFFLKNISPYFSETKFFFKSNSTDNISALKVTKTPKDSKLRKNIELLLFNKIFYLNYLWPFD